MKLLDLPENLRPRERAEKMGVQSSSDAELVAIILRSGRRGMNVIRLAEKVLFSVNGELAHLAQKDRFALQKDGLGSVQAITLLAALELGHRMHTRSRKIVTMHHGANMVIQTIRVRSRETFFVIPLDMRNRVIGSPVELRTGSRHQVLVEPREILGMVLQRQAARFVILHNHPSQHCEPSTHDILLTKQILEGCQWMDLELVDHIIVTHGETFSMKEKGMLE